MNGDNLPRGFVLGKHKPVMPEITIYVAAELDVREGCDDIGDATHYLSVALPFENREIRIPCNARALRDIGRKCQQAGGIAQPATETEGNKP